jgi:soluble lytic murein transglycosylase
MKKNLLIISFSALLLVSPGISSQTTDKHNTVAGFTATQDNLTKPALDVDTQNGLILANLNLDTRIDNHSAILDSQYNKALEINIEIKETDVVNIETTGTKYFSDEQIAHLRELFLQAETALKNKKEAEYFLLADQLKEYPLYPYLQYQWLIKHLDYEKQIKHFLEQHKSSRYAGKLKSKWLHHLANKKQWSLFLQYYSTTSNASLNCYRHIAQFHTGSKQAALDGAKKLWAVGHSQPGQCDPLFAELKKSSLFTQDLLWQRFAAALQNNKIKLATYVKSLMPAENHSTAQLWLNLHKNPSRHVPQLLSQPQTAQSPLMFNHAINRLASKDLPAAIKIWDTNKQQFSDEKSPEDKLAKDKIERRLAFKLASKKDSAAYERLSQLDVTDNSSRTRRIRVALQEQNWQNVIAAIQDLSEDEKEEERWLYWLARAYLETGKIEQAESLLSDLSNNRSFYGYLAADKVNSIYQLSDNPVDVSEADISALKNRNEFCVAFELMVLDRNNEAKLQWWHAVRPLNKKEILVAAKLAQQWQWDEIAIFTIAKAKYWDDIEIRFPLSYTDKILENSAQQKLNPVILYGLIRRESAFNENARSPTGARGLMQIMPRTGRDIARNLKERWRGNNSLYNPVTNLKYGAYYYQKLLTQFDGHYALALAAYNAGPHRVKQWLPETESLPADIWIETIPFHETREYVTNVLAYALIYQQRTQSNELSMNDFTRDIQPLD